MTLAEIAGRIERLTDVVFGKSIRWFARHLASSRLQLCLNLLACPLTDPDLPDRLERTGGERASGPIASCSRSPSRASRAMPASLTTS